MSHCAYIFYRAFLWQAIIYVLLCICIIQTFFLMMSNNILYILLCICNMQFLPNRRIDSMYCFMKCLRVVSMCKYFQESVKELSDSLYNTLRRHNYVTPTSYLELILTFKTLLNSKRYEVDTMRNRYLVGLEKLEFASSQVSTETARIMCSCYCCNKQAIVRFSDPF